MNEKIFDAFAKITPTKKQPYLPGFSHLENLLKNPPNLPPIVIEKILRQGWKAQIASGSGAGKSFLLLQLGIAIANGLQWLKFQCTEGKVLYLNLEIDEASFIDRMDKILTALDISLKIKNFDLWNLRGFTRNSSYLIESLIEKVKKGNYSTVIVDPIYKLLDGNENSNYDIKNFLAFLDEIALEGPAVAIVHHFSKGTQGGKAAMDRNSGAGVFARDPDAMITLTPILNTENAFRVETAKARNFPTIKAFSVRFQYPIHVIDPSLDELKMEGQFNNGSMKIADEKALSIFRNGPLAKGKVISALKGMGCSERGASEQLATLIFKKVLFQKTNGREKVINTKP